MHFNRFIFHNPHTNIWYKTPLYFYLTKRKSYNKYEYLLDYCLENNIKIGFLCDGLDFSFGRSFFRGSFVAKIELRLWCMINGISTRKVELLTSFDKLQENDVVYSFLYGNFTSQHGVKINEHSLSKTIDNFKKCKAFKIVNLTHYMFSPKQGSKNLSLANIDLLVAENNLSANSSFFKYYYSWYKNDVYTLPFIAQPRFKPQTEFATRKNKAVATGTLMFKIDDDDFLEFFPTGQLHPMRKAIFDNKEQITDYVDSYISAMENVKAISNSSKNLFQKISNFYYIVFKAKQKQYFSFNIVSLYNSYKMFIVPEEIIGLPGIGFIEGMSCGTVFIGKEDPMYSDIGMISGVNYIGYDGTLDDLLKKIAYYQQNEQQLNVIAEESIRFVQDKMQPEIICKSLFADIDKLLGFKLKAQATNTN